MLVLVQLDVSQLRTTAATLQASLSSCAQKHPHVQCFKKSKKVSTLMGLISVKAVLQGGHTYTEALFLLVEAEV